MKNEQTQIELEKRFRKAVQKNKTIRNAYMLIHSDKHGIHLNMAEGSTYGKPAHSEQPYIIASIDKLLTSVLMGILEEQGELSYEDPIDSYLEPDMMKDLHIYKGKDYSNEIKIRHLLNHTSGLYDFVEDKPKKGTPMLEMLLKEATYYWTPEELIEWSKEYLTPHFPPGEGFHYSDTGFFLLNLIFEKITAKSFHEALAEYLFKPLGMNHSYMLRFSEPIEKTQYSVAECYAHHVNVAQNKDLGLDYAGGRVVATTEDLLKFMKALTKYQILRKETMEKMKDWAKFSIGIDYGYGIMNFKHVPIFMPKKYSVWGNAGSAGSFMFYHPELEAYFIGSLNHFRYHRKGIMLMFKMIDIMLKNTQGK